MYKNVHGLSDGVVRVGGEWRLGTTRFAYRTTDSGSARYDCRSMTNDVSADVSRAVNHRDYGGGGGGDSLPGPVKCTLISLVRRCVRYFFFFSPFIHYYACKVFFLFFFFFIVLTHLPDPGTTILLFLLFSVISVIIINNIKNV